MLSSRIKKRVDTARLGSAVGFPGIDPRSWLELARVDDDKDAIRWETDIGWLVDVTISSGELAGEGPIPCRVASCFAASGEGSSEPFTRGCEVLIAFPHGDPNSSPTIIAQLHNAGGCEAPTTINGKTVDEALAMANHLMKSSHGVQAEYAGDWQTKTGPTAALEAEQTASLRAGTTVNLGGTEQSPPTDANIKGTTYVADLASFNAQLTTFVTAVQTFAAAMATAALTPPLTPLGTMATTLATAAGAFLPAVSAFTSQAQASLSLKVKTE